MLATTQSSMFIDEKLGVTYLNLDKAQHDDSGILQEHQRLLRSQKQTSGHMTTSSLQDEDERDAETISILSGFDRGSFSTVGMQPGSISKLLQKDTEKYKNLVEGQPGSLPHGTCRRDKEYEVDMSRSIPSNNVMDI